jgi:AhpD family alkylhydroperoxidase
MKTLAVSTFVAVVAGAVAMAQDVPRFFSETYPPHALDEAMALQGALGGEEASLDAKTRELIGLAVAAQIPCTYCVYFHRRAAEAAGATEAEIKEAVALAADTRHWSTVLNGMEYDLEAFKTEYDQLAATN